MYGGSAYGSLLHQKCALATWDSSPCHSFPRALSGQIVYWQCSAKVALCSLVDRYVETGTLKWTASHLFTQEQ